MILLKKPLNLCDVACTSLRKIGIKIYPSKGPGTPLKIASSEGELERYLDHRDNIYLLTSRRLVKDAYEAGEAYKSLSERSATILSALNNATK